MYLFSRRPKVPKLRRTKEIRNNVIVVNAVMFFDTLVCSIRPYLHFGKLYEFWTASVV